MMQDGSIFIMESDAIILRNLRIITSSHASTEVVSGFSRHLG